MTRRIEVAEVVTGAAVVTITMMKIMTIGEEGAVTEVQEGIMMTNGQGMDLHVVLAEDLVA
jgi:hypothetical protein